MFFAIFISIEGGMDIVELNERCRFLLYIPGQNFPAHRDGCYVRPSGNGNTIDKTGNISSFVANTQWGRGANNPQLFPSIYLLVFS